MILDRIATSERPIARLIRKAGTSGVGTYLAYVVYGALHPQLLRPGTTDEEARRPLKGDEVIADPDWQTTFAIRIDAAPADVWPWIVQIGWGRAGWYTWYPLDNGAVPSADRIVPELQRLAVGDAIPDGPRAAEGFGVWRVLALDPERLMLLHSRRDPVSGREAPRGDAAKGPLIDCSWAFVLERVTPAVTRLVVRVRARTHGIESGSLVAQAVRLFFGLGDNVMERTLLEGVKRRAEGLARSRVRGSASSSDARTSSVRAP